MTPAIGGAGRSAAAPPPFGDVTVSRMGLHRPRGARDLAGPAHSTLPRQAKGMRMRYSPQPIEFTLRQRQALQPSASEPCLSASSSTPTLPKIGAEREMRGTGAAFAARTAKPSAGPGGFVAAGWEPSDRFLDLREEAWLGILNGGRKVAIPFGKLAATASDDAHWLHKANVDPFVRWYRTAEAEAAHRASAASAEAEREAAKAADRAAASSGGWRLAPSTPWAARRDEIASKLKGAAVGPGLRLHLQARAALYSHLDDQVVMQGFGALLEALRFVVGSLDDALRFLDVNRSGSLSLMEFVGCMSVLGLDLSVLCGSDDAAAFRELAAASAASLGSRGAKQPASAGALVRLETLARARSVARRAAADGEAEEAPPGLRRAQAKWAAAARWMAAATRRSTALTEDRFSRGWRMTAAAEGGAAESGPAEGGAAKGGAAVVGDPAALPCGENDAASDGAPSPARRRRRCAAPANEVLLVTAAAMRECEQDIRAFFIRAASSALPEAPQERMMDRQDLHSFFSDLQLVEPVRHRKAREALDLRYDEALALQADHTKIDSGLLFWSFKALLNNIVGDMRLGWGSLVPRTIQAGEAREPP